MRKRNIKRKKEIAVKRKPHGNEMNDVAERDVKRDTNIILWKYNSI